MLVGARYYDPALGLFITRDTVLSQPAYQYCNDDPVNAVDPSGHDWRVILGGIAVAGGFFLISTMTFGVGVAIAIALIEGTGFGIGAGIIGGAETGADYYDQLFWFKDLMRQTNYEETHGIPLDAQQGFNENLEDDLSHLSGILKMIANDEMHNAPDWASDKE